MNFLELASLLGITVTELKKSIITKVKMLEALGMSRSEAESIVKETFFKTVHEHLKNKE